MIYYCMGNLQKLNKIKIIKENLVKKTDQNKVGFVWINMQTISI